MEYLQSIYTYRVSEKRYVNIIYTQYTDMKSIVNIYAGSTQPLPLVLEQVVQEPGVVVVVGGGGGHGGGQQQRVLHGGGGETVGGRGQPRLYAHYLHSIYTVSTHYLRSIYSALSLN